MGQLSVEATKSHASPKSRFFINTQQEEAFYTALTASPIQKGIKTLNRLLALKLAKSYGKRTDVLRDIQGHTLDEAIKLHDYQAVAAISYQNGWGRRYARRLILQTARAYYLQPLTAQVGRYGLPNHAVRVLRDGVQNTTNALTQDEGSLDIMKDVLSFGLEALRRYHMRRLKKKYSS